MMTYQIRGSKVFYDFKMLTDILGVHPSYLKRAIKKYGFSATDYIRYKNRHLYSQEAVIDFVIFLVREKLITDIRKLSVAVEKIEN